MTGSERPSPEPFLKKEASPAVLGGREFWKRSGTSNALNYRFWGIPAVLSRRIPGNALRAFLGSFRNFFRKVPAVLGVWPRKEAPFCFRVFPILSAEFKPVTHMSKSVACACQSVIMHKKIVSDHFLCLLPIVAIIHVHVAWDSLEGVS